MGKYRTSRRFGSPVAAIIGVQCASASGWKYFSSFWALRVLDLYNFSHQRLAKIKRASFDMIEHLQLFALRQNWPPSVNKGCASHRMIVHRSHCNRQFEVQIEGKAMPLRAPVLASQSSNHKLRETCVNPTARCKKKNTNFVLLSNVTCPFQKKITSLKHTQVNVDHWWRFFDWFFCAPYSEGC